MATSEDESTPEKDKSAKKARARRGAGARKNGADANHSPTLALLKEQHETLLSRVRAGDNDRRKGVRDIDALWQTHRRIENEIVLPAARKAAKDQAALDDIEVRAEFIDLMLDDLVMGADRRLFDARLSAIAKQIEELIALEEKPRTGLFALALSQADPTELNNQIKMFAEQLGSPSKGRTADAGSRQSSRGQGASSEESNIMPRTTMRERDDEGRFVSDDDNRNYHRGGGSRSGGPDRDEYGRFMSDDDDRDSMRGRGGRDQERQSRRYDERRSSRYEDDDDRRGQRRGGWFGDSEGHSEASRRGWDEPDHGRSGWYGDPQGHSEASRRGWDEPDHGRSGWYGDPEGHSEASRRGWEERRASPSRSSRYDERRSSRYDDDDVRGGRRYDDDNRGRRGRGWYGDSEGHSQASRRGWDDRR